MFDFQNSLFQPLAIPQTAKIVFVSDMFVDDYVGGAELTSEALISSSPFEVHKLRSKHVTMELLKQGVDKFWIFGNFAQLNPQLIPSIVANMKYSILEYDYKYCKVRSPEKHKHSSGVDCDCHDQMNGKIISAFFHGSMGLWWMSEKQKNRYMNIFPFLSTNDNIVLSSVFSSETLGYIKALHAKHAGLPRSKWIVLGSDSWVKGKDAAIKWCQDNNKEYEVIWNIPYNEVIDKLATAEGFVYLPEGGDTCPRMVIEAKLLGCKLHLNDNVQHKDEEWFNTDDLDAISDYLFTSPKLFWNGIKAMMNYKPSISGYTTTYNCVRQEYPFKQCIASMLMFCDEVCVVDGGSTDGTWESLKGFKQIVEIESGKEIADKLVLKQVKRNWAHPRHAIFDGMQKAEARKMCTKEFCWQMDSDEVVHLDDASKIAEIARAIPKDSLILALPVIEYWGGPDKVRLDVNPWKWRLSRNAPDVTHGIPADLRRTDSNGETYAALGTDGCDMISASTGNRLPFISFYNQEIDNLRNAAISGDVSAVQRYEQWFNLAVTSLPSVFHYSWYDINRKIKLYRDYWQNHWAALFNKDTSDVAENNMFFDVPWSQVTDEMIELRAKELAEKTGGHIWHSKWNGQMTPWIKCNRTQPKLMKEIT